MDLVGDTADSFQQMGETSELLDRPVAWVATVVVLAFAAIGLQTAGTDWAWVEMAACAAVVVTFAAWRVPWDRLPRSALLALPTGCDLAIALLRQAQGGSTSGYSALAILPVVFVGLMMGRREVAAVTATTTALFATPILVVGAPMYPSNGWRGVVLWTVVAFVVGSAANRAMSAQRRYAQSSAALARELDGLVATQSLIATSSFDLDTVMGTVVAEARRLTDADAAVIELPEGDELVYRAVSGTAEPHLGLRLAQETALSGSALRTGETLLCEDSDTDERVDRETCREVGARSMVVVPLRHDGATTGVLKVYSDHPYAFGERHAKVLALLASLIGSELARADLMRRLRDEADTDQLTGLPNRRSWYERLREALVRARRYGQPLSVVLLDLDDFKQINDSEGHAAGDRLLRAVSAQWAAAARESDFVGRIGGDEFAVILERADSAAGGAIALRLVDALVDGQRASVGVATWDGSEDEAGLMARADESMYRDKREGKPLRSPWGIMPPRIAEAARSRHRPLSPRT